jgi:protein SCO1/2
MKRICFLLQIPITPWPLLALAWILLDHPPALAQERIKLEEELSLLPQIGQMVPRDLSFRDSTGKVVQLNDYLHRKPIVLMPVYYRCPMLCGLELQGLVRCLRAMEFTAGKEFEILTFSIDPKEKPELAAEKKANYLKQYQRPGTEDGWHFLTGEEEPVQSLCQSIGFRSRFDPKTGQFAHAAVTVILTPEGRIARYLMGVEFAPRDLRMSLVEASENRLATFTDRVLLFCYAYDHTQGKYALAIFAILRAAGVLTTVVLFGGIGWFLVREKRLQTESPATVAHLETRTHS